MKNSLYTSHLCNLAASRRDHRKILVSGKQGEIWRVIPTRTTESNESSFPRTIQNYPLYRFRNRNGEKKVTRRKYNRIYATREIPKNSLHTSHLCNLVTSRRDHRKRLVTGKQDEISMLRLFSLITPLIGLPTTRPTCLRNTLYLTFARSVARARAHLYYGLGPKKSRKFRSACRGNRCHLFVRFFVLKKTQPVDGRKPAKP